MTIDNLPVVVALVVDGNLAEAVVVAAAVVVAVDHDSCLGCIAGVVHGSLFDVGDGRDGQELSSGFLNKTG